MFQLTSEQIEKYGAVHTAKEIHQQPTLWRKLFDQMTKEFEEQQAFIKTIRDRHESVRVIFSGAGTSAFIGDILVPALTKYVPEIHFESIATTDIVANPLAYFVKDRPTILVSFARSGNSPESVATVALGQQMVDDFYQVVITCNSEGQLAKNIVGDLNSLLLLMPEESNDQSLAMTSSFSTMMLAAYLLFNGVRSEKDGVETNHQAETSVEQVAQSGERLLAQLGDLTEEILKFDFKRIVYLGSGLLGELGHEASLKMLELTAGQVVPMYESSLGFRHGPKSILDDQSLVVFFMSQDDYTRKYDVDMLKEIAAADSKFKIIVLTGHADQELEMLADWLIPVHEGERGVGDDFYLALPYIIFAQTLAMKKSIQLGFSPDNPSPDGAINRVVQGVKIYDFD